MTVPNFHDTEANYNAVKFVYHLPQTSALMQDEQRSLETVLKTTEITWNEGQSLVEQLRLRTPEERRRSQELESLLKTNLKLKVELFNKNRKSGAY